MKILFLHGWQSVPGGVKPAYLAQHGHEVLNPALPDDDFEEAVRIAQREFDQHRPDVVVGSSRGGALAMNLSAGNTPLVLLCPAWKKFGEAKTVKKNTLILHSRADDVVPFSHSEELVRNSGLPASALIEVGSDHRLADPEPLAKMLEACESAVRENSGKFHLNAADKAIGEHLERHRNARRLMTDERQRVFDAVVEAFQDFVYYDRLSDEALPREKLLRIVRDRVVSKAEIASVFRRLIELNACEKVSFRSLRDGGEREAVLEAVCGAFDNLMWHNRKTDDTLRYARITSLIEDGVVARSEIAAEFSRLVDEMDFSETANRE